jgi:2-C-methyl-D-erythritol 4-phosphate cytidylyltransferase
MARLSVLLMAAGKSSRFKDREKKPFVDLDGRAVWLRSAELFVTRKDVVQTLIVIAQEDEEEFRRRFGPQLAFMNVQRVFGGPERADSVERALAEVRADADLVAIHDAVRPCVTAEQIDAVLAAAERIGAAILACPVTDTIKRTDALGRIEATVPRERLWLAQTPQVFRRDWLVEAYAQRSKLGPGVTDDAQLVEAVGHPVVVVESHASNIKITHRPDLALAEAIIKGRPKPKTKSIHPFADEAKW